MHHLGGRTHLYMHIKDPHDVQGMAFVSNPVFEQKGLDAMLVPINVRKGDLEDVLPRLAKLGNVKGFLISMPFKESVIPLCSALGPQARLTGSVNCVRIEAGGRLTGEMFDGQGLLRAASANGIAYAGKRMLLLGAGGAARAIAFAAVHEGVASIEVFNRTHSRAERLVADLQVAFPKCAAKTSDGVQSDAEFIVSCIPGLGSDHLPAIDPPWLRSTAGIIDIVPAGDTDLLKRARAKGAKAVDGRPMILHQIDLFLEFIGMPPTLNDTVGA